MRCKESPGFRLAVAMTVSMHHKELALIDQIIFSIRFTNILCLSLANISTNILSETCLMMFPVMIFS